MTKREYIGNEIKCYDRNLHYNQTHEDKIVDLRYAICMHGSCLSYLAEFKTMEQLQKFAARLGFEFSFDGKNGRCSKIIVSRELGTADLENEKPEEAQYLLSLSNGSYVENWFTEENGGICIHRINPNNKKFYNPLPLEAAIKFMKENGTY